MGRGVCYKEHEASPEQAARMSHLDCSSSIDLHCHCLPGLDDGPATVEDSLALCRALVADGITAVIATPHQLGRYDGQNSSSDVRAAVIDLQDRLNQEGIPLQVLPGGDIRLDERLVRLIDQDVVTTVADKGVFVLVEMPHEIYVDPSLLLNQLVEAGRVPVITHPERHRHLQQHQDIVQGWVEQGAILQITAGSLIGEFGRGAIVASRYWIARGWVGVVASDAHGAKVRPPRMSEAIEALTAEFGLDIARKLCVVNPASLAAGTSVSPAKMPGLAEITTETMQVVANCHKLQRSAAAVLG